MTDLHALVEEGALMSVGEHLPDELEVSGARGGNEVWKGVMAHADGEVSGSRCWVSSATRAVMVSTISLCRASVARMMAASTASASADVSQSITSGRSSGVAFALTTRQPSEKSDQTELLVSSTS